MEDEKMEKLHAIRPTEEVVAGTDSYFGGSITYDTEKDMYTLPTINEDTEFLMVTIHLNNASADNGWCYTWLRDTTINKSSNVHKFRSKAGEPATVVMFIPWNVNGHTVKIRCDNGGTDCTFDNYTVSWWGSSPHMHQ